MNSLILSVLGIDASTCHFNNEINLYHLGDEEPFANLRVKNGVTSLRVNSGEICDHASNVILGRYAKS